jgi:hypothetical protein
VLAVHFLMDSHQTISGMFMNVPEMICIRFLSQTQDAVSLQIPGVFFGEFPAVGAVVSERKL